MTSRENGDVAPRSLIRLQSWLSPAFPTGSYSYSHSLEAAVESNQVHDRQSLVDWLDADLRYGSARNDATFLVEAWRCAAGGHLGRLMNDRVPDADLCFIESGGDNLAATFSPELADVTIYVIDVAAGEKIPRKGGPGITRSDLLVINKTDLAPLVGANLTVMETDVRRMRQTRPFIFTNLKSGDGVEQVARFLVETGLDL